MQRQDVDLPDPADPAAVAAWGQQMNVAVGAANGHRVRLQQIDAVLTTPVVLGLRSRLQAAAAALAAAQAAADAAAARAQAAEAALLDVVRTRYADAENAVADATKAVADELARLMASATTTAAVTATVDGLGLRERYRAGTATDPPVWDTASIPFRSHDGDAPFDPEIRLPALDGADYPRLLAVLSDLDDAVDAVADVVAAESVHQLVAGNLVRSGASLEIAASGTVTDAPDVVATPAPGHDLTHRVLVLADPDRSPAPSAGLVGTADPLYAGWLAGMLPDPSKVQLGAAAVADDGTVAARTTFSGDALGLDAPGWLRVTGDVGELTARVALVARPRLAAPDATPWTGRIVLDAPEPPAGRIPLAAVTAAGARLRAVMTTARSLTPADLAGSGEDPPGLPSSAQAQAVDAVRAVQAALHDLDDRLARAQGTTSDGTAGLTAALLSACDAGLAEAAPPAAAGPLDLPTLVTLAGAARARLAPRLAAAPFVADPAGPSATVSAARDLLPRLCGAAVPLLLAVPAPTDALVRADLAGADAGLDGGTAAVIRTWLADHARVRPAVAALLDAHDTADALGAASRLRPRASQLPRAASARWAGADPAPTAGLVDLVVVDARGQSGGGHAGDVVAGLAIDTWVQTVPAGGYDSAVAFHYDEPRTDPAQAILVAVAADPRPDRERAAWALGDLVGVVTSTMALARQRAVAAELHDTAAVRIGALP
ncbi:MAG TPA: hypothetical protein VFJ97_00990 [Dermatophilaceae bacterium]|nr:hypothetical protein [Dermatophilaceae bacterium]